MGVINKHRDKIIVLIILIGIFSVFLVNKNNKNIKLEEHKVNNKQFAMYKKEGDQYIEIDKFPGRGYKINSDSYCLDNNKEKVDDILSYQNGKVTVTSNKTVYCTLYFDKLIAIEIEYINSEYTDCKTVQCALDDLAKILK